MGTRKHALVGIRSTSNNPLYKSHRCVSNIICISSCMNLSFASLFVCVLAVICSRHRPYCAYDPVHDPRLREMYLVRSLDPSLCIVLGSMSVLECACLFWISILRLLCFNMLFACTASVARCTSYPDKSPPVLPHTLVFSTRVHVHVRTDTLLGKHNISRVQIFKFQPLSHPG
jgi:hypothetical protein